MKVDMKLSRSNKTAGKNVLLDTCFQAPKSVSLFKVWQLKYVLHRCSLPFKIWAVSKKPDSARGLVCGLGSGSVFRRFLLHEI